MPKQLQENTDNNSSLVTNSGIKLPEWCKDPKRWIIVLIVLVVISGLLYIAAVQYSQDRQAGSERVVEIMITADGFNPSTVLIHPGTTVTWINQDSQPHWVASDPHPTHEILAGFDTGEPIGPGQTYSYTFENADSYNYHDHLSPETNGTVLVED